VAILTPPKVLAFSILAASGLGCREPFPTEHCTLPPPSEVPTGDQESAMLTVPVCMEPGSPQPSR
jgi:hypothetical protein